MARIHHGHAITQLGNHTQIVADEEDRNASFSGQFLQDGEHLRLDRHVQRCCGFVRNEEVGSAGKFHSNHDPLAHTPGELVGVFGKYPLRVRHLYLIKHINADLACLSAFHPLVKHHDLLHLITHSEDRVEGTHRFLENHRDFIAPDVTEAPVACGQ